MTPTHGLSPLEHLKQSLLFSTKVDIWNLIKPLWQSHMRILRYEVTVGTMENPETYLEATGALHRQASTTKSSSSSTPINASRMCTAGYPL